MDKPKPKDFDAPAILLGGPVDHDMYKDFTEKARSLREGRPLDDRVVDPRRRS